MITVSALIGFKSPLAIKVAKLKGREINEWDDVMNMIVVSVVYWHHKWSGIR